MQYHSCIVTFLLVGVAECYINLSMKLQNENLLQESLVDSKYATLKYPKADQ